MSEWRKEAGAVLEVTNQAGETEEAMHVHFLAMSLDSLDRLINRPGKTWKNHGLYGAIEQRQKFGVVVTCMQSVLALAEKTASFIK